jgi:hypothetical protein
MLPPPFVMHLVSSTLQENSPKKPGVEMNYLLMSALRLSTGFMLLPEDVQMAAYYPSGSLRNSALLNGLMAGHVGVSAKHEQDFLYVRTIDGAARVSGNGAAHDATVLEEAGVRVYRSPQD